MYQSEVMESLAARVVADSTDRVTWLAARQTGVTATDIARLANGGPGVRLTIIAEKRAGAKDKGGGNARQRWGTIREAELADSVQVRDGIKPSTFVFHAVQNRRHLATPDGVGINFDDSLSCSEIKTTIWDLGPGPVVHGVFRIDLLTEDVRSTLKFWTDTYYYDQMQWEMHVVGADRTRFTWEVHDNDWSGWPVRGPKPVEKHSVWIPRDEARIAELVALADGLLFDIDSDREAMDAGGPTVDETLDTLAVNALRFADMEAEAAAAKEQERAKIKAILEASDRDEFAQVSALARISWKRGRTIPHSDTRLEVTFAPELPRKKYPELYEAVDKAEASVVRAQAKLDRARAALTAAEAEFQEEVQVPFTWTTTVKENLTITNPNRERKQK